VDPNIPTAPSDHLTFYNAKTGEAMAQTPINYFYRLRRSALRGFLVADLDIRYEKSLTQITYSEDGKSATATFADGSSLQSRLIVGADGSKSTVRELLLGSNAFQSRLPVSATFIQAKYTREQALFLRSFHPLYLAGIHPDNKFCFFGMQYAPEEDKPESWTFFFYISFNYSAEEQDQTVSWGNERRLAQVKEFAKSFAEPWKSAHEWLPDNHPVWHMNLTEWEPGTPGHKWDNHNGRVTLAGDAAHVMTYQRGQGLNHSMQDAAKLCDTIIAMKSKGYGDSTATEHVSAYEDEMIQRTGNEVRQCTVNTMMLHDWEKMLQSPVMQKGMKKE
jgi:2-polyprenyl-6-methoxyphenol hydroxylase-like FAD-dependent oxidoreductase